MRDGYCAFYRWELEQERWLLWPKSPWESVELHPDLWSAVPVFYHILFLCSLVAECGFDMHMCNEPSMFCICLTKLWPRDTRGVLSGLIRRASMAGLIQGLQSNVGIYSTKFKPLCCLFGVLASVSSGEAWRGSGGCSAGLIVRPLVLSEHQMLIND